MEGETQRGEKEQNSEEGAGNRERKNPGKSREYKNKQNHNQGT